MKSNDEIFEGKSFQDLTKDIYENTTKRKVQIDLLISEIHGFITTIDDVVMVAPIIKEYMDTAVRNDEHLVKLAGVLQRIISKSQGDSDESMLLSDSEKEELMSTLQDTVDDLIGYLYCWYNTYSYLFNNFTSEKYSKNNSFANEGKDAISKSILDLQNTINGNKNEVKKGCKECMHGYEQGRRRVYIECAGATEAAGGPGTPRERRHDARGYTTHDGHDTAEPHDAAGRTALVGAAE